MKAGTVESPVISVCDEFEGLLVKVEAKVRVNNHRVPILLRCAGQIGRHRTSNDETVSSLWLDLFYFQND
jgi:hypothetical protein